MNAQYCPTCRQPLPAGQFTIDLQAEIDADKQKALAAQRPQIEADTESKFKVKWMAEVIDKVAEANKEQERQEKEQDRQQKEEIAELKRLMKEAAKDKTAEINQAKEDGKMEAQLKSAEETLRLQKQVGDLQRQLENKSNEERREESERDLLALLKEAAFPDYYERIGRGEKGGDILQTVMDGDTEAGRIVFEVKNTKDWLNAFITQARKYRTQYETPYVMIVSRDLPKEGKRGMCVVDGIPIVEPHLAPTFAAVMRESILEISKLRLTKVDSDQKAQKMFAVIISDWYQTRACAKFTAITGLKDLRDKEQNWHERHWEKERKLIAEIEKCDREINTTIQEIIRDERKTPHREDTDHNEGGLAAAVN